MEGKNHLGSKNIDLNSSLLCVSCVTLDNHLFIFFYKLPELLSSYKMRMITLLYSIVAEWEQKRILDVKVLCE